MSTESTREAWVPHIVVACVAFGAACRARQYLANTSLWHDESFIALNVLHSPIRSMLGPQDWNEPSPPGFLLLEKLVVAVLGSSEQSFRLIPLLVGLVALVAFAVLARRITAPDRSWLYAVTLFSFSGPLIDQTNLVKHFSFDVYFAIAFAWLALRAHAAVDPRQTLRIWGVSGAVAPWLSYASVFSFGATSLTLALFDFRRWKAAERRAYVRAHLAPLISMAMLLIPIRAQRSGIVVTFWNVGFPDTESLWRTLYWLVRTHLGLYHYLEQPVRALGPLFVIAGVLRWWRQGRRFELLTLWGPIALAFVASCIHYWPFGGNQHMSFAAPAIMMSVAVGISVLVPQLHSWHVRAPTTTMVVLFAPALLISAYHLAIPRQRHDMRAAIRYAEQGRGSDDQLVVIDPATYFFYSGIDVRTQQRPIELQQRVWIITPTSKRGVLGPEAQTVFDRFSSRPRLDLFQAYGAAAYLLSPEGPTS